MREANWALLRNRRAFDEYVNGGMCCNVAMLSNLQHRMTLTVLFWILANDQSDALQNIIRHTNSPRNPKHNEDNLFNFQPASVFVVYGKYMSDSLYTTDML